MSGISLYGFFCVMLSVRRSDTRTLVRAQVGFHDSQRFVPVFDTVAGTSTPLPTWGVPVAFLTLDMMVVARGACALPPGFACRVMGVSPNTTRLDSPHDGCDHRAVFCSVQ